MALTIDDDRALRRLDCESCGRSYEQINAFVYRDGDAYAIYYAQCHSHDGDAVVWLDLLLGSWHEPDFPGHVAFSCRVAEGGAGLVNAPATVKGRGEFFGEKLTRSEA